VPGLEPRVVEHLVDEPEQVALAPLDAPEVVALRLGDGPADPQLEQLGVAADGVERRAQLVAHHRQELALRAVGPASRAA
jgi:hypothetical protein